MRRVTVGSLVPGGGGLRGRGGGVAAARRRRTEEAVGRSLRSTNVEEPLREVDQPCDARATVSGEEMTTV